MVRKGSLMVGYQPQGKIPNSFRNVVSNPGVNKEDIEFLVNEIDNLEKKICKCLQKKLWNIQK